ncbi:hypothetical protein CALVIDRAFT_336594 [Calocera viscosa TUFC12733]|uniref:Uncharacterized protein n=1 Tax=Calocera viscosa (strain TUFC12733) TaxID=1330018 RepID=A0A167HIQ4_CALVF|nr:hypothetical protein CALVIDRAFT_336594 [Calocera viscosa TUFC12733]
MKAELDELKKKMGGEGGTTNRGWQTSNGGGGVYGTGANRGGYGEGGWRGGRGRGRGGGYGGGGGGGQRGGFDRDTGTSPQYTAVAAWSSPAVAGGEQWPSVTAPAGDVSSATPAQQNSSGNATATVMADTQPPTETGVTSGPAAWGQPVVSTDATTGGWGTITSTADAEAWPASQPWS